jgi:sodium/potassium-transporting ATPase subunit alpha
VIQALFAFYQGTGTRSHFYMTKANQCSSDWSSSRVMSSIKTMLPDQCLVLRDGAQQNLISSDLTPGDILYIRLGDKLPADVRFVESSPDGKFDRSILTGQIFILPLEYSS